VGKYIGGTLPVRTAASMAASAAKFAWLMLASVAVLASAANAGGYCSSDPRVAAVDLSAPVDHSFLETVRAIGIKTVIRYYDHENETLPGKTLRRGERDLILMNGFHTAVVFQHHNDRFASFTAWRGRQDAERSLALAGENSQPRGSAIYFGVDGAWSTAYELANIMAYFREVKATLAASGYRVGVYGSGLMCNALLASGLAELCWLAAPTSWPEYHGYYQTGNWGLAQLRTTQCGGRSVDFNLVNGGDADYGQFGR
jgi:Domain of unknown function (DUF1906)